MWPSGRSRQDARASALALGLALAVSPCGGAGCRGEAELEPLHIEAPRCDPGPGAYCEHADLRGADLEGEDLRGVKMIFARLEGANLRGADLRGAQLTLANLRGVDLRGADLRGAQLWRADLKEVQWEGAVCPTGEGSPPGGCPYADLGPDEGARQGP